LKESESFQKSFKIVTGVPFILKFGTKYELGFTSHVEYYKFFQILKKSTLPELQPEINSFISSLEVLEVKKWNKSQVIEWLGTIYLKGIPLSFHYEDLLKDKIGHELICFGKSQFLKWNPDLEEESTLLNDQRKILVNFESKKLISI
jgi:hypothetical protein